MSKVLWEGEFQNVGSKAAREVTKPLSLAFVLWDF